MVMKIRLFALALIGAGLLLSLNSCNSGQKSAKTGWTYNNSDLGGYEYISDFNQETGPGLVLIEGGTYTMGRITDDIRYDWNNIPRRVTVSSFYMDETEVTNADYREYLYWLKRVFVDYPQVYMQALPDTLVWRNELAYNEPMVEYYLRHPAYNDYPVVGVSWIQANRYCEWRTDRVNEMRLISEGILEEDPNQRGANNFNTDSYLAGQYEGIVRQNLPDSDPNSETRHARMEDGYFLPKYRLPTEAEWEFAALGVKAEEEVIENRKMYPWRGNYTRNDDKRNMGMIMANYARGRGDYMGVSGSLNDGHGITSPVRSYWPNDYGLYDMAGNVNEWVLDVYRPLSLQDVDEFRPYRGNIFTVKERDADGNIAEKDSLGRIPERAMSAEENRNRANYKRSDLRNFKDGDLESSLEYAKQGEFDPGETTSRMYFQGDENLEGITTRVSDNSRVYKGGSWRDRAYWLVPGTRRYMDEREARDDLGFRCAMSRLGREDGR
ncbi:MAG: SUMF1/EgtB/PvdO family nonheme iron enzyme [Bacteroidetes bacterium]|nr:SUMF1/EgtB/PvdO family nonheme iron enzyme [Bacteroidota bacterium]